MQRVLAFLLPALLAGSLALNLWSIDFGQPAPYDQCVDPVLPVLSLDAVDHLFGERNIGGTKYPRLHFVIVGAAQRAWFAARYGSSGAAERLDPLMARFYEDSALDQISRRRGFRPYAPVLGELIVVGRVVSALMGTLCVLAVFLFVRELRSRSAGLIAGGFIGASYPFVYYAHTCNVDVPYLMWGMFAFWAAARAVRTRRAGWVVGAAVLAALSAGTKDQAGGWFLFAAPALLWLMRRESSGEGGVFGDDDLGNAAKSSEGRPVAGRVSWTAVAVAVVVSVLVLAFCNGLPFDVVGARAHFGHIFGVGHTDFREFDPGYRGQWLLLGETLLHLKDGMGLALLALSLGGSVLMLALRPRIALLTLLPAASYYVVFIGAIGYVYLRFALPVMFMLAIAAAFLVDLLIRVRWARAIGVLLALAIIGERAYSSARMVAMMDDDPRPAAEAWLEREAPTAVIAAVVQIPIHNIEFPMQAHVQYVDVTTVNPGYGEHPPGVFVLSWFDPPRKLLDQSEPLPDLQSVRLFARDYDLAVKFAPSAPHPVRRGISFQPTVVIYRLREPVLSDPAVSPPGAEPSESTVEGSEDGAGG